MIVITGPGRSGTSFLARLYQELGFDPIVGGGRWHDSFQGGLEDAEVVVLNNEIIDQLRMRSGALKAARLARRLARSRMWAPPEPPPAGASASDGDGPAAPGGDAAQAHSEAPARPGGAIVEKAMRGWLNQLDWTRIDSVAARHRDRLQEISRTRLIVKDPQFCQTLAVWAGAAAPIEHVVVSVRATAATAEGLLRIGNLPWWSHANARNVVAYRLGLLVAALHDHRIPYTFLRFPDFLDDDQTLFDQLPLPAPVQRERFLEAFEAARRPDFVHSWS